MPLDDIVMKLMIHSASFVSDVEMAHEAVYSGPISESVPSSITGFAHRRARADSSTSFTYMQDGEESSGWTEEEAIADQSDNEADEVDGTHPSISPERRKSSGYSRTSVEDPLLRHRNSTATDNQWGEFEVHELAQEQYGHSVSTVFGLTEKEHYTEMDEDDDPIISTLHLLDYRYMRFVFHPLKDKFMLCSNWTDPSWTNVKSLRAGLDSDERYRREQIFGKNQISIRQKSIPQLLIDEVPSTELVPSDVYEVSDPSLTQLPCDSLLLAGDCIVNESMLTGRVTSKLYGESVPVSKVPATNESLRMLDLGSDAIHPEAARNFLFSGTKIIRARRPQDGTDEEAVALAIVARTGFNTTKGALVRSMLFPKPSGFKFYKDAFRYISVMAAVAAVGFLASFVNFLAWHLIVVRALDLITIVVPPALPATLSIGTSFALSRLKIKSIFCISPQRFGELLSSSSTLFPGAAYERDPTVDYDVHRAALHTMASCHSLRNVEGELVGDPLDLKMFEFTNWTFTEGSHDPFSQQNDDFKSHDCSTAKPPAGLDYELDGLNESENNNAIQVNIIKGFEFVSQLRRASVIVSEAGNRDANIYVKGAPECMREICRSESCKVLKALDTSCIANIVQVPMDYEDLLGFYTQRGFRVIACATKQVPHDSTVLQKMKRETAESGLDLIGFIIFENKLKPATTQTIEELERAAIRQVMCTGDNILTAISVTLDRDCIKELADQDPGNLRDPNARLSWQSVDNPLFTLDEKTLKPLPPPAEGDVSLPYDMSNLRNCTLAVTGDVFRWIIDFGDELVLQRMLVAAQVFARMSPDEKHELVEKLQSIDYCCGFCGDGANDCGALKAADVGISLSEAEASVAAPFTSRVFDVSCVPEARIRAYAANDRLQVSFHVKSSLRYWVRLGFASSYRAWHLNTYDGRAGEQEMTKSLNHENTNAQQRFIPPVLDKERSNIENSENTTLYLLSCFQYIFSAIILSIGPPFRQSMTNNGQSAMILIVTEMLIPTPVPFVVTIVVALLFSSYMLFDPAAWLASSMQLTNMTARFRVFILILAVGGFACGWIAERKVFLLVARMVGQIHDFLWPQRRKQRKRYKTLLNGMHWVLDGGYLPQPIVRYGIRSQLQSRIKAIDSTCLEDAYQSKMKYVEALRTRPMAIETATANAQHYEVGTGVLQACLGPRMKYSCCLYPAGSETLGQAEIEMLDTYVEKAELKDGMAILDLGCGWGSGALYFAELFPHSQITAFSNSKSQKKYIDQQASSKGLSNLRVITGNIVDHEFDAGIFDRVISIELFEHMKNYALLMAKVAKSLKPGGKLFVHIFTHKTTPYDFEDGWMSTHFFSGGTMPSADLLHYFQQDLTLARQWWISGKHYAKTCEDWLSKLSNSKTAVWPHLEATYGEHQAGTWFQRWKIFYMACAELFAFGGGETWGVSHYLFEKGNPSASKD
ncbi:MAG: hypothetical protein Q9186_006923 [Xanthomendoza sp. 1 TL-2023]